VRTLVGVIVVVFVLVPLAAAAMRGVRRVAWPSGADDVGRTALQTITEGLIVLAAVIVGVIVVVAIAN